MVQNQTNKSGLVQDLNFLECFIDVASFDNNLLDQIVELSTDCFENAPISQHFQYQARLVHLFVNFAYAVDRRRLADRQLERRKFSTLRTLNRLKLRPKTLLGLLGYRVGKDPQLSLEMRVEYLRAFTELRYYAHELVNSIRESMPETIPLGLLAEILRALVVTQDLDYASSFYRAINTRPIVPEPDSLEPGALLTIYRLNRVLPLDLDAAFVRRVDQRVRGLAKISHTVSCTEKAVGKKLTELGYSVHPQMAVHGYAVDLVVADFDGSLLLIEVMGDKFHYLTTGSRKHPPTFEKVTGSDLFKWMVLRTTANVCYLPASEFMKLEGSGPGLVDKIRELMNVPPQ